MPESILTSVSLENKRVLVTGGLGFIGHHLVDHLLDQGCEIVVVDNQSANVVPVEYFRGRAKVEQYRDRDYLGSRLMSFDWICHLASTVGPLRVMKTAGRIGHGIVSGTSWLIDMADRYGIHVLYISTSELYGVPGRRCETDSLRTRFPFSGRTEYSCAKLLAEIMLSNAGRVNRLRSIVVRPFNVVGPRQSAEGGFVLPRFVHSVRMGQSLTVYGNGKQQRCFTHVLDLVDAIVQLMEAQAWGLYNVGTVTNKTTIFDLAIRFRFSVLDNDPSLDIDIEFKDPRELHGELYEEAPDKIPDTSRLLSTIAWNPKWNLEAIVEEAAGVFQKEPQK